MPIKFKKSVEILKGNVLSFKNLKIKCLNKYALNFLTSIDNKSLSKTTKIILNTSARVENSNMRYNPSHTSIIYGGNSPIIIEPILASLEIKIQKFKNVKIFVLDENNNYIREKHKNLKPWLIIL